MSGKYPVNALSTVKINRLKPGFYADGNCLYLAVETSGTKHWIVRTTINGKRCDVGIGGLKYISLEKARKKAIEIREVARDGRDPLAAKREERKAKARERDLPTFETAARKVYAEREKSFRNELHKKHWIDQLEKFAFPHVGKMRVDQVTTADVMKILNPIWLEIPDTAKRVKQRMGVIFEWAKASQYRIGLDNPVEGIEKVLPKRPKGEAVHYAALPYSQVPEFIRSLQSDGSVSGALAFEFLILTASRTNEVVKAKWSEIDFKEKMWTRPAANMKANRVHKVPLSPRCEEILKAAKKISDGGDFIFPGMRNGEHLSNMVFIATLKRMEKSGFTAHGFRSSFRDWAEERTTAKRHAIETALAHVVKDKVEAAYLRTVLPEQHRELLEQWAAFVMAKPSEKVVKIRG